MYHCVTFQIGEVKIPLCMVDLAQTIEEWKDIQSVKVDDQVRKLCQMATSASWVRIPNLYNKYAPWCYGEHTEEKKMLVCKVLKRIKNLIFCRALIFFRITPMFQRQIIICLKGIGSRDWGQLLKILLDGFDSLFVPKSRFYCNKFCQRFHAEISKKIAGRGSSSK